MIAMTFPTGSDGETIDVEISVSDAAGASRTVSTGLQFTFASHAENDRQPRNRAVDRRVAMMFAARARRDAVEHQRAHEYERARGVLIATAKRIGGYAGGDAELLTIAEELQRDVAVHNNMPMSAPDLKKRHFEAYNRERSRESSGKPKRHL